MNPIRPVDLAMAENRPEKKAVRNLWLEEVRAIAQQNPGGNEPWYLSLPGSEGLDIQMLIEDGLISLTEVNSIAEKDQGKVVAVESSNRAVAALQRKFVGLQIREVDFRSLIRAEGVFRWPEGDDEKFCRARVVNLDLNCPLEADIDDRNVTFRVLAWIEKLCHIHAKPPRLDWTLCLTLHGEIAWPEDANRYAQKFLRENLGREPFFDEGCRAFFGADLYEATTGEIAANFNDFDRTEQQKIVMVLVPKIISRLVHDKGWRVRTERNLRYGTGQHAPMVTWIVKFTWDQEALAEPDANYCEALRNIFSGAGVVTGEGEIT